MFGVDEGANAALLLCFRDRLQRERRLAGAFRTIDLDDAAAWQAADAERDVEAKPTGRNRLDLDDAGLCRPLQCLCRHGSYEVGKGAHCQ